MVLATRNSILLDRAIFGSSNHGLIKGYQLLSWSTGLDAAACKEISQWSPTRLNPNATSNETGSGWTLQTFPVGMDHFCLGRSFAAGEEYSGRGGPHVVSAYLIVNSSQWQAYDYDALGLLHTAMALGHLRIPLTPPIGSLEKAVMPGALPLPSAACYPTESVKTHESFQLEQLPIDEWTSRIADGNRLILVGLDQPVQVMASILQQLSSSARRRLSFTTGLPLSAHRPFQIHFIDSASLRQQRALATWLSDAVYEF